MEKTYSWNENLTGMPGYKKGNLRGIQGSGNEMLAVSRALKHGLIVFFKAWPDTNYDLVVDCNSRLYRVEVKGTGSDRLSLTRGWRAGKQIDRKAKSRSRKIDKRDCDVLIGVNAKNGDCYIVPIRCVLKIPGKTVALKKLEPYKEKWSCFTLHIGQRQTSS